MVNRYIDKERRLWYAHSSSSMMISEEEEYVQFIRSGTDAGKGVCPTG
jgi:hypothetical protein